jgi:hypothetical protein
MHSGVILTRSRVVSRGTRLPFPSPSHHLATALLRSTSRRLCSPWPTTVEPLLSSSMQGKRLAIVASSSSTELELEPPAINVGWASSPRRILLLRGSPSIAAVWAPPASPPLQEEPLESIVRPRLHLRHWRRPPPSSSLTTARPLWWAPFHPTATHGFPLVQSSSTEPPCLASRRWLAGIGRQGRTGEGRD